MDHVLENIKYRQICLQCLEKEEYHTLKVLVQPGSLDTCNSVCDECVSKKNICVLCKERGHLAIYPQLRACDLCIKEGTKCVKFSVMVYVSD